MGEWCAGFDNWAIVDTVCFHLFDKSPDAWAMTDRWAAAQEELTKRAAFALLWALALHDKAAADHRFRDALPLVEANATDPRRLVTKAQVMALRAIATKRPALRPDVLATARRLVESDDPIARRVGRPIVKAFG